MPCAFRKQNDSKPGRNGRSRTVVCCRDKCYGSKRGYARTGDSGPSSQKIKKKVVTFRGDYDNWAWISTLCCCFGVH